MRMHGLPTRTGLELINALRNAAETSDIVILTECAAERLLAEPDGRIRGVEIVRGDGTRERIGCDALILACNGYGGNPDLVRRFIPEMANALYFGHPGNRGDAVIWGDALGAQLSHLGAYQGHGSVATPHNILITWAVIMQGGIQINSEGRRFCDEFARLFRAGRQTCCASRAESPGMCSTHELRKWRGSSRIFATPSGPVRS